MAGEAFPKDELGMMLPVIIPRLQTPGARGWNRHHAWYYARRFLIGTETQPATDGSRVLRYTRIQNMPVKLHERIHYRYQGGSERPQNEFDEFKLTLLGWAGYIPEEGLHIKPTRIKRAPITPKQREILRRPGVFTLERDPHRSFEIGDFVMKYITEHGLEYLVASQESLVAQYIEEPNSEERQARALRLVRAAASIALDPFELPYGAAREAELLRHHAPRHPDRLVVPFVMQHVQDVPDRLQFSLRKQIYGTAA